MSNFCLRTAIVRVRLFAFNYIAYGYAADKADFRVVSDSEINHTKTCKHRQPSSLYHCISVKQQPIPTGQKSHSQRRFTQKSCHVLKNSIHGNILLLHYKLTLLPDNFADINAVSTFVMLSTSAMAIVSHALCMAS